MPDFTQDAMWEKTSQNTFKSPLKESQRQPGEQTFFIKVVSIKKNISTLDIATNTTKISQEELKQRSRLETASKKYLGGEVERYGW